MNFTLNDSSANALCAFVNFSNQFNLHYWSRFRYGDVNVVITQAQDYNPGGFKKNHCNGILNFANPIIQLIVNVWAPVAKYNWKDFFNEWGI